MAAGNMVSREAAGMNPCIVAVGRHEVSVVVGDTANTSSTSMAADEGTEVV